MAYESGAEPIKIGFLAAMTGPSSAPTIAFNRGVTFAVDTINNKTILIRFRWTNMNSTPHFEQSFSDDGGKTP